jgi:hypothetical protein
MQALALETLLLSCLLEDGQGQRKEGNQQAPLRQRSRSLMLGPDGVHGWHAGPRTR